MEPKTGGLLGGGQPVHPSKFKSSLGSTADSVSNPNQTKPIDLTETRKPQGEKQRAASLSTVDGND